MRAFLEGNLAVLRGLQRADVAAIASWGDDREVTRYLFRGAFPANVERAQAEFDRALPSTSDIELAVWAREPEHLIGVTGLHSLNWVSGSAEFRILLGEKAFWGKGIGTEVTQLLLVYAFEILNLNKVWLGVNSENVAAVRSYARAGFQTEGVLRQDTYRNSRFYDTTRMSMLRREYDEAWPKWAIADRIRQQFPR